MLQYKERYPITDYISTNAAKVLFSMLLISRRCQYQEDMIKKCGAVGGMTIGRRKRSIWRKTATDPFCPQQIPYYFTFD
jgi:hypothetical protein